MGNRELLSIIYHDLFDFPLTQEELVKWTPGRKFKISNSKFQIENRQGFYFLKGRAGLISKRLFRRRIAKRKMRLAQKTARILGFLPTIKLVAITGGLAMENTSEKSDIDFLIITSVDTLWLTRLLVYVLLGIFGFKIRRQGEKNEKDKLCLNMWLDENNLVWPTVERNMYSAHEFGQMLPLVNKKNTYEHLMHKNIWIKDYWPNI